MGHFKETGPTGHPALELSFSPEIGQLPDSWAFSAQSMQGCEELWQKGLYYSSLRIRFYHFSEASWPEQNCSVVKVFKEKSKIAGWMSQFSYSKTQCETIDTPRGPTKTPNSDDFFYHVINSEMQKTPLNLLCSSFKVWFISTTQD